MNFYKEITKWKQRPLIYSSLLFLLFAGLINLLERTSEKYFFIGVLVVYMVLLGELFFSSNYYHIQHRRNSKKRYEFESHKIVQYLHHIIFPTITYYGIVLFTYFNEQFSVYFINLILVFALFSLIFENIFSFYNHNYSLNKSTNYVYDLVSVILVFMWVDVVLNFSRLVVIPEILTITLLLIIFFVFGYLAILRHAFISYYLKVLLIILILKLCYYLLIDVVSSSVLNIALLNALSFQALNFIVLNKIERTINKESLLDYILILMLLFSLMYVYGI